MNKTKRHYYIGTEDGKNLFKDERTFASKSYAQEKCSIFNMGMDVYLKVFPIDVIIPDIEYVFKRNKDLEKQIELQKRYIEWMWSDDTGLSSQTIFYVMTGIKNAKWGPGATPSDSWDFGRCYRLLGKFPEFRPRLKEVSRKYKNWVPLIKNWGKLEKMYLEKSGDGKKHIPEITNLLHEFQQKKVKNVRK